MCPKVARERLARDDEESRHGEVRADTFHEIGALAAQLHSAAHAVLALDDEGAVEGIATRVSSVSARVRFPAARVTSAAAVPSRAALPYARG